MYVVFITMLTVFTLCEAALVSKRSEECEELMQCFAVVSDLGDGDVGSVEGMTHEEAYEQVCGNNDGLQSCFVEKKQSCRDPTMVSQATSTAEILDYLCSEEGRKAVKSLENSPCVKDEQKLIGAQGGFQTCMITFQSEFETAIMNFMLGNSDVELCPFVDQLNNCVTHALTEHCGHNFGSFFKSIWDIAFKPTAQQLECDHQLRQIRHLQTRIIPLVVSGAKRRR